MACDGVDEVIQKALKLVRGKLNSQVASIFLFTKNGVIKRRGINGIDKDGNSIENEWFFNEEYAPGASFSGKAIPSFKSESGFGEPQWSNDLHNDFTLDEETKTPYSEKLGSLKSAISVPLNGRYRTFGTIEVLNKLENNKFSHNDVYWLTHIATIVANFISDFRRKKEVDGFTEITQKLIHIEAIDQEFNLQEQEVYNLAVQKITEDYTPYKACILRIADKSGNLEFKAKSGASDVNWLNIRENVKKTSSGIAVEVFNTKEAIFIENIAAQKNSFYNQELIKQNNFKAYVCIPLLIRGKVFGTISVFIGYCHEFSINHQHFLNNIAVTIAKVRLVRDLYQVRQERDEARDEIFSAVRFARGDYFLQGVLHQYKNDLLDFSQILKTILTSHNTGKTEQIIENKLSFIKERIKKIQAEFVPEAITVVNVNEIIKQVLKSFSGLKNIEIVSDFNYELPFIEINEAKITDIIYNLVSNAIKSIKIENKKVGKMFLSTDLITSKRIQYIQIIVEDNGEGIRNEYNEKIFEKGFTTSKERGGTGMGLFVSREIIHNYGGKIEFDSTLGKGTKFIVKIPLKRYLPS